MSMIEVNDATFREGIRKQGVTLLDFGAEWCPPCKVLKPLLQELAEEQREKLTVLGIDCDESPQAATEYGVMSIPTVVVFHDGQPAEKIVGLRPKAFYESLIDKYRAGTS